MGVVGRGGREGEVGVHRCRKLVNFHGSSREVSDGRAPIVRVCVHVDCRGVVSADPLADVVCNLGEVALIEAVVGEG